MKIFLPSLFAASALLSLSLPLSLVAADYPSFDEYARTYKKTYFSSSHSISSEYSTRKATYEKSILEIKAINGKNLTWTASVNEYSDMSWEEFKNHFNLHAPKASQNCSATGEVYTAKGGAQQKIDWRQKGVVTEVKNQGSCGSCWTFSTTGAAESAHMLVNGVQSQVLLSEQQLVDCAGDFNNFGCNGGLPSQAFQYIMANGGITTEKEYPYTAKDGKCVFDPKSVAMKVVSETNITAGSDKDLTDALASHGPVSVAFEVASDFKNYKDGVYDSTVCKSGPMDVNHAVLAVGFDLTHDTKEPYYIVKNSWGSDWGMQGYFNIAQGKNMCGIATCASFPVAAKLSKKEGRVEAVVA